MRLPPAGPVLAGPPIDPEAGTQIGQSREGRPIRAYRFGTGRRRVSLLGGCHADEPVGPRLLRHVCGYLNRLPANHPMLTEWDWWLLPHINPDGDARNRSWYSAEDDAYDPVAYLMRAVREPPGGDIEFGFPRDPDDVGARPENRALYEWWGEAEGPFALHVSLHGMALAAGPWFLIEPAWADRCEDLKVRCAARVAELGYVLHDVERRGEKGFFRLQKGFCTRPDSRLMRQFFQERGDEATARLFRPSSMETIRSFGGDPLTLVSEMPLFVAPGVGETLGPPDPVTEVWRERIESWRERLQTPDVTGRRESRSGGSGSQADGSGLQIDPEVGKEIAGQAQALGLRPMPVRDQMDLQWTLVAAGLEQVRETAIA